MVVPGQAIHDGLWLPDNPTGRAVARQKVSQIELDIQAGYFDPSLLKYRPGTLGKTATEINVGDLFAKFTTYQIREKSLAAGSVRRYSCVQSHVEKWLSVSAHQVTDRLAGDFTATLIERASGVTVKSYLYLLAACWDWAKDKYHVVESNPWTTHICRIKKLL